MIKLEDGTVNRLLVIGGEMKRSFIFVFLAILLITGCSSSAKNVVTATSTITNTSTSTLSPTNTATPTETPTSTPTPTLTPTPIGSGLGKLAYIKTTKNVKPDNTEVYIANIFIYDFATNQETQITKNEKDVSFFSYSNVNWTPDGQRLVFNTNTYTYDYGDQHYVNSIIFTMDTDGTSVKMESTFPQFAGNYEGEDVIYDSRPIFVDNDKILLLSNRKNLQNFLWEPLKPYILNTSTLEVTSPFTTYLEVEFLSMSPDQTKISFMASDGDSEIFISDLSNNGAVTQITKNNFSDRFPMFSPDGEWIAFHSDRDGNIELYVMKVDGSEVKRVTLNPATDATSSWSPDGKWLSFYSDQTGNAEAFIQNIETGERIQITNGGNDVSYVRWSP